MTVWLIRGYGRNILVDSGFYVPGSQGLEGQWFRKTSEAVIQAGVKPEEIPM